jgi:iron complex transport system permease protein
VLAALTGRGTTATDFVVLDLRLARALCAVAIGAALGASGAAFQALTRNPLGSPDIIGLTSGAATGALLQILVIGGTTLAIAGGALVGGLASAVIVYLLAAGRGAVGYRLILVGIGLNAMLWAVNSYLLITARLADAMTAQVWLIGSLNGRTWAQLWPVLGILVICLPLLMMAARPLGLLEMGDDSAKALGVRANHTRIVVIVLAVALAAGAVATAGPIAFVALAAPQLAKRLTGSVAVSILPAALMGAFVLATSDVVAQRMFAPVQLPVGIATGAVGGLYLVWLLLSEWKKDRG